MNKIIQTILGTVSLLISTSPVAATELVVPAYFYPSTVTPTMNKWPQLTESARQAPITAIANLSMESTTQLNPEYAAVMSAFRAAGGTLFGYVGTHYGDVPPSDVQAGIDRYALYGIDGLFLDEMDNGQAKLDSYYRPLYEKIKQKHPGYTVIGNPGTNTLPGYLNAADVLVTFEGNNVTYGLTPPSEWQLDASSQRFAALVYDTPEAELASVLALAGQRHAGHVYVTDGGKNWDTLPSYWDAQVSAVPEPGMAALAVLGLSLMATFKRRAEKAQAPC
jgi:hypothetical protein